MKKSKWYLLSTIFLVLSAFKSGDNLPANWIKTGSAVEQYAIGIDQEVSYAGNQSAYIKSQSAEINGFGTLMQTCSAASYLGKKIKMTAYVKSENVSGWAGLWLRIDGRGTNRALRFDNMQERPIKGSSDWKKYEIVLAVPSEAYTLNFGALLNGGGSIWFDQLEFEVVADNTSETIQDKILPAPTNIDFEK